MDRPGVAKIGALMSHLFLVARGSVAHHLRAMRPTERAPHLTDQAISKVEPGARTVPTGTGGVRNWYAPAILGLLVLLRVGHCIIPIRAARGPTSRSRQRSRGSRSPGLSYFRWPGVLVHLSDASGTIAKRHRPLAEPFIAECAGESQTVVRVSSLASATAPSESTWPCPRSPQRARRLRHRTR